MKQRFLIITILFLLFCSSFSAKSSTFLIPPANCDSLSGFISLSIDSGTCYKRYVSVRLYNNLLNFHHWERSYDGTTYTNISTSSVLTQSNVTTPFWVRAVVKTGSDSCYSNYAYYNEVCAYDTIKIENPVSAYLSGFPADSNTNYGSYRLFQSWCWTTGGVVNPGRSLMKFSLSSIPIKSIINKSSIYLFGDSIMYDYHNSPSYGHSNESYLYRVDSAWTVTGVKWKNQPKVDTATKIYMPQIGLTNPNAIFDITGYTQRWVKTPSLNYGIGMRLKTETPYASQVYAANTTITAKKSYLKVIYYKPQIFVDTKGFNTNGDSIFIKAEVGSYRKTFYSGIKQNVILDSISTYPGNLLLKVFKKGVANDTTSLQLTMDSAFRINAVKILKDGSYTNYSPDNYFSFDNKITFYSGNLKKDNFSSTYKLNLKNGLKMILFPNGNPSGNDTTWRKLYVVGSIPPNSKACLIIYDSFNNIIYKTYSPTSQWDGRINNQPIAESNYKYVLYINDLVYRGQFFVEYKY